MIFCTENRTEQFEKPPPIAAKVPANLSNLICLPVMLSISCYVTEWVPLLYRDDGGSWCSILHHIPRPTTYTSNSIKWKTRLLASHNLVKVL